MSTRAYKIIKIETEESPTFNCWHDQGVADLGNTSGDIISFEKDVIVEALDEKDISEERKEILSNILIDMTGDEYVEYYCY